MFVYLDNSATTKPSKPVVDAMTKVLTEDFGNPSALYNVGLTAEKILKEARANVAKSLGADPSDIFFTSGGTESDNWVLKEVWESRKRQGKRIISTSVEHPAILRTLDYLKQCGADVVLVNPREDGIVYAEDIEKVLTDDTILVSVMHVNNETGAVMPIEGIREILDRHKSKALFHTDAVQSYGKLPIDVKKLGVDFLSLSGHKVYGPKGIGALYIKNGLHLPIFVHGGGQESGLRSGTENMPGIAGLGAAASEIIKHQAQDAENMARAKAKLLERIKADISDIKINSPQNSSCSVLNISFLGCRAEVLLHMLEQDGICVSTGSACSSKDKGSHVLAAMKLKPEEIEGAIRFSFSAENTKEEMVYAADKLKERVEAHRKLMSFHKR